jgi:FkbM family methyltransferase
MINVNQTYTVHDHQMFLDEKDSLGLVAGTYESHEMEVVKREVQKGDVVLDIGANIGFYTLMFAKLVGSEGQVFAFEPEPENFRLLKKNVEINGYQNVILVPKAISNKNGTIQLYLCESNQGMHRIYDSVCCQSAIDIESIRADDYFSSPHKMDFIKMDIEGAEYAAIQGMQNLLTQNPQIKIMTEFSPLALFEYGVDSKDYINTLLKYGFTLFSIGENVELIEHEKLLSQLTRLKAILEQFVTEEPDLKNRAYSLEELVQILTTRLNENNYTRPLFENFLCLPNHLNFTLQSQS